MLGQNILILGFGREGVATLKYLLSQNHLPSNITIYDHHSLQDLSSLAQDIISHNPELILYLGVELSNLNLNSYSSIIKSPGIPNQELPSSIISKLTSATQLFFDLCPAIIIGVTGTKGKSTTSSLIYSVCRADDRNTILVGNIGRPALDHLADISKDSVVVFELSSHQLSHLTKSPHIAVILGIFPEHLDYYQNMDEYVRAKGNITKFQSKRDYLVYNAENNYSAKLATSSASQLVPITKSDVNNAKIIIQKSHLQGDMNAINIAAALKVSEILSIDSQVAQKAIIDFVPLEHRLQNIGKYKGIVFYNDSLSAIPQAAIAALDTLGNSVSTIILGGFERNLSYLDLAKNILKRKALRNLIFFPTTGEKIWEEIIHLDSSAQKRFNIIFVDNMKDAVNFAFQYTRDGEICLLSPGATSFSSFKDYRDRGNQFREQVQKLST